MASLFLTSVKNSLNEFAPFSGRILNRPSSPWLTHELKLKLKNRDAIYKQSRRTRNSNLLLLYKILRRELEKLNDARDSYLKSALENDSQGLNIWTKLKRLGILKSKHSSPLDHFDVDLLNNLYASTVTKHPLCDRDVVTDLPIHHTKRVNCSFNWSKIDIVDVTKSLYLTL